MRRACTHTHTPRGHRATTKGCPPGFRRGKGLGIFYVYFMNSPCHRHQPPPRALFLSAKFCICYLPAVAVAQCMCVCTHTHTLRELVSVTLTYIYRVRLCCVCHGGGRHVLGRLPPPSSRLPMCHAHFRFFCFFLFTFNRSAKFTDAAAPLQ